MEGEGWVNSWRESVVSTLCWHGLELGWVEGGDMWAILQVVKFG